MSGSDNYEVTLTIVVGGNDPADAVRAFMEVLADTSWHPCYFEVNNLEAEDERPLWVTFNGRTGEFEVTT